MTNCTRWGDFGKGFSKGKSGVGYNQRDMERGIRAAWFTIETANLKDLGGLRQLEQVCFPRDAWPLLDLLGVLSMPGVVRLKAVAEGRMIGFIAGDVRRPEQIAWIATIGVLPEFRGRGVGAALLQACEARIHAAGAAPVRAHG